MCVCSGVVFTGLGDLIRNKLSNRSQKMLCVKNTLNQIYLKTDFFFFTKKLYTGPLVHSETSEMLTSLYEHT